MSLYYIPRKHQLTIFPKIIRLAVKFGLVVNTLFINFVIRDERLCSVVGKNVPCYPDGMCCMFAVLLRFVVIDICMFVNSALVHKEILVDLHDG